MIWIYLFCGIMGFGLLPDPLDYVAAVVSTILIIYEWLMREAKQLDETTYWPSAQQKLRTQQAQAYEEFKRWSKDRETKSIRQLLKELPKERIAKEQHFEVFK